MGISRGAGHGGSGGSTGAGVRLSRDAIIAGGEGMVGRGTGSELHLQEV
jgi:hypothetical protein